MITFRFQYRQHTICVHATRQQFAEIKAHKLVRLLFSARGHSHCRAIDPTPEETLQAQQMSALLGEPVYTGPTERQAWFTAVEAELSRALSA